MRNKKLIISTVIALIFGLQSTALADGGAPLLLLVNLQLFLYGMILIIYEEWRIYKYMFDIKPGRAFADVLIINIASTVVIGFCVPLLIAIVSGIGSELGGEMGDYILASGTWVIGDNSPHPDIALIATGVWFIVTFFLTVYFELWVLKKMWKKREFNTANKFKKWSWTANIVSYGTLVSILGLVYILYLCV